MNFMWKYLAIFILSNAIALGEIDTTTKKETKQKSSYRLLREFSGYKTGVDIKPGEIKTYAVIDKMDYNNLSDWDKKFVEKYMPDWKGERYRCALYKWSDTGFVFIDRYYTNSVGEAEVNYEEYDEDGKRNLPLPEKYLKIEEIKSLIDKSMIKSYAESDLNLDGDTDFVIVYHDTTGLQQRGHYNFEDDCHLVIFEREGNFKYIRRFEFNFPSYHWQVPIGKVEIKDVNKDNLPEVILWEWSKGASGWSIIAIIFTRIKD